MAGSTDSTSVRGPSFWVIYWPGLKIGQFWPNKGQTVLKRGCWIHWWAWKVPTRSGYSWNNSSVFVSQFRGLLVCISLKYRVKYIRKCSKGVKQKSITFSKHWWVLWFRLSWNRGLARLKSGVTQSEGPLHAVPLWGAQRLFENLHNFLLSWSRNAYEQDEIENEYTTQYIIPIIINSVTWPLLFFILFS